MSEFLQLYYTSCEKGASGYAGFQTRAMSQGIDLSEQREIERLALYVAPRSLPPDPDELTIKNTFPAPIKMVQLSSGRVAVVRCQYIGQDYSGRWGNYFAHALLIPSENNTLWPIDVALSAPWRGGLDPGEGATEPSDLPPLPQEQLRETSLESLSSFLSSDARSALLKPMLFAAFHRMQDARSLVIRTRDAQEALLWIACLQKAFPLGCQAQLTSATYQVDPSQCLHINATYGATDFLFNEMERKFQFYMFDLVEETHSDVPDIHGEYVDCIANWLCTDPARLRSFHEFSSNFSCNQLNDDLTLILRLFQSAQGNYVPQDSTDVRSLLDAVGRTTKASGWNVALDSVEAFIERYAPRANAEDWGCVAGAFQTATQRTGEPEYLERMDQMVNRLVSVTAPEAADWRWAFATLEEASDLEARVTGMVNTLVRDRQAGQLDKAGFIARTEHIGRGLGPALGRLPIAERWALLNRVGAVGSQAMVVIGEWKWCLEQASNPVAMHAEYEAHLLAEPSDFSSQWGSYLRHALWTTLIDASARPMLAAYWAASPAIHTFEPEIRAAVVNAASHQISLSKNHPESTLLAQKLRALIETGGTEKVPERVILRDVLDGLLGGDLKWLITLRDTLRCGDESTHNEVLSSGLPHALRVADSAALHGAVIEAFNQNRNPEFLRTYCEFWSERERSDTFDHVDVSAVAFWLTVDTNPDFASRLAPIQQRAIDAVARRVGQLPASTQRELRQALGENSSVSGNNQKKLESFMERAMSLKRPWWKKLFGG